MTKFSSAAFYQMTRSDLREYKCVKLDILEKGDTKHNTDNISIDHRKAGN